MPAKLYGGAIEDFADSMAAEMETALNEVRGEEGLSALPTGDQDRRMLFIAIARGVINHLRKKQEAFAVTVTDGTLTFSGTATIDVKPPPEVS
jgi:hypothetical protein